MFRCPHPLSTFHPLDDQDNMHLGQGRGVLSGSALPPRSVNSLVTTDLAISCTTLRLSFPKSCARSPPLGHYSSSGSSLWAWHKAWVVSIVKGRERGTAPHCHLQQPSDFSQSLRSFSAGLRFVALGQKRISGLAIVKESQDLTKTL